MESRIKTESPSKLLKLSVKIPGRNSSSHKSVVKRTTRSPKQTAKRIRLNSAALNRSLENRQDVDVLEDKLNYYRGNLPRLLKRVEQFCTTGKVMPDVAPSKKSTGTIKKVVTKSQVKKKVPTKVKEKKLASTSSSTYPCPNGPSRSKNVVRYEISDGEDDIMQIEDLVVASLSSEFVKDFYSSSEGPTFEQHLQRILSTQEPDREVLKTSDIAPPTLPPVTSLSTEKTDFTDDDMNKFVDDLLGAQYTPPICKRSNKDFLADTDELLLNTIDLLDTSDKPETRSAEESVLYVDTVLNDKPIARNRLGKNLVPLEVIDLSTSYVTSTVDLSGTPDNATAKSSATVTTSDSSEGQSTRGLGDCPVCLEPLGHQPMASTICGHIFCDPCIRNTIRFAKKCPNCRKNLKLSQIHPLFI